MSLQGGCLCGRVRYEITADPIFTAICHCRHCQKQSGSAFSVNLIVAQAATHFGGELKSYVDRGEEERRVVRRFCPECGSAIVSELEMMPGVVAIKAGTLDDPSAVAPSAHIWCEHRQPWVEIPAALTQAARNPPT